MEIERTLGDGKGKVIMIRRLVNDAVWSGLSLNDCREVWNICLVAYRSCRSSSPSGDTSPSLQFSFSLHLFIFEVFLSPSMCANTTYSNLVWTRWLHILHEGSSKWANIS
eukprot:TRINITY_DN5497_c0_g2_i1.p1 TRINITY_DN5497_c0_g2~~TRINITY_DN5497_c0_g2_i1.p1  ORF type:complete len:110 (+),score=13.72 TRINITY_DN5497_c0_g2_i1:167-496(+)